jgi:peptidoglycan/xylan/chitin deacetylase (PgdA/CDA1 family)
LGWPVEERFARFVWLVMANLLRERSVRSAPMVALWPGMARFAFVLTHDVETTEGQSFVGALADLEERHGFRSSFNFVPERYPLDKALMEDLRRRGFEIGVHGLKHDGKLFSSRALFERRVKRINRYLSEWDAVGFRSPLTHRNPEWMQALDVEYDLSFFDTDCYETMPGGTMSIWPFLVGRFVEMPYTLVQDHTLMIILREQTPRLWLEKVGFIERFNGMVLLNAHPDYLRQPVHLAIYETFLREMQSRSGYWHALPYEVARWWRARAGAQVDYEDERWVIPDLPEATVCCVQLSEQGVEIAAPPDRS